MPPVVWDQGHYLYDEKWTEEVDNMFIDIFIDQTMAGLFRVGANNNHCIEVIQWIISNHFQKEFSFLECNRHLKKIQKRHRVFDWLVHMAGVLYDIHTNSIIGAAFIWDHICTEQPFAYAYMTKGEPKWRELQIIFNDAPSSLELFNQGIINVSSSDEDEDLFIVQNQGVMFGPVVLGIPVYDVEVPEMNEAQNAPNIGDAPVIDLEGTDNLSPENMFWKDVMEGYAYSDEDFEGYGGMNAELMFRTDLENVWLPDKIDAAVPSPTPSMNSLGYLSLTSSASSATDFSPIGM